MYGPTGEDEFDWAGCPVVEWDSEKLGGRANVNGTRMFADTVLDCFMNGMTAEDIAETYEMEPVSVRALISFAGLRQLRASA